MDNFFILATLLVFNFRVIVSLLPSDNKKYFKTNSP